MGYSRDSFTRVKELYDKGGETALFEASRSKPNHRKRVNFCWCRWHAGIWLSHGLETFKKRLIALETIVAEEGIILTEAQVTALEKKKEQEAFGEIEPQHPG